MDLKTVKKLAELAKKMNLTEIDLTDGDKRILIKRGAQQCCEQPQAAETFSSQPREPAHQHAGEIDFNNMREVRSPMVGVFYSAPSPEESPYVSIGETVKKGQILCIIEAMKVLNEIVCEHDGEIIDICARNGDIVEYGQTLFKIY